MKNLQRLLIQFWGLWHLGKHSSQTDRRGASESSDVIVPAESVLVVLSLVKLGNTLPLATKLQPLFLSKLADHWYSSGFGTETLISAKNDIVERRDPAFGLLISQRDTPNRAAHEHPVPRRPSREDWLREAWSSLTVPVANRTHPISDQMEDESQRESKLERDARAPAPEAARPAVCSDEEWAQFLQDRKTLMVGSQDPEFRSKYSGKHVAVYEGKVVDYDSDRGDLIDRIGNRYGSTPVYVGRVGIDYPRIAPISSLGGGFVRR